MPRRKYPLTLPLPVNVEVSPGGHVNTDAYGTPRLMPDADEHTLPALLVSVESYERMQRYKPLVPIQAPATPQPIFYILAAWSVNRETCAVRYDAISQSFSRACCGVSDTNRLHSYVAAATAWCVPDIRDMCVDRLIELQRDTLQWCRKYGISTRPTDAAR